MSAIKSVLPSDTFDTEIVRADLTEAMKNAGVETIDGLMWVDPAKLYVMPNYNMRVHGKRYKERVEFLKKSMIQLGYDQTEPITVFAAMVDDEPRLVVQDGHHRLDSAMGAKIKKLTIVPKPQETTAADLQYALILKNSGEPPAPYEAAVVVKRLVNQGEAKKNIAKNLSVTTRYVDDLLVLADAPAEVIDAVVNEQIAATFAIQQLRAYEPEAVIKMVTKALARAEATGKTKVTKKDMVDAPKPAAASKKAKARKPSKVEPETLPVHAVEEFLSAFESVYSENDQAAYEISFDVTIGHVATLLNGPADNEASETLGQGIGASLQHACAACVKDYHAKKTAAAAADL